MLNLISPQGDVLGAFPSYDELLDHLQLKKLFWERCSGLYGGPVHPGFSPFKPAWNFTYYKNPYLASMYPAMRHPPAVGAEKFALEHGLDYIEIFTGDADNPTQIAVTPDVDVPSLKQTWCQDYCRAHGYAIQAADEGTSPTSGISSANQGLKGNQGGGDDLPA